jgi:hypothetical protein
MAGQARGEAGGNPEDCAQERDAHRAPPRTRSANDQNSFELTGSVKLLDSDGFWLETDRATVNRVDSIAHIPGAATFGKGG